MYYVFYYSVTLMVDFLYIVFRLLYRWYYKDNCVSTVLYEVWFAFQQCDAVGCFGDVYKRRKRSSIARDDGTKTNTGDLNRDIVCHHCCNGDFCNMYGCPDSCKWVHTKRFTFSSVLFQIHCLSMDMQTEPF